jgi:hypothetical protein
MTMVVASIRDRTNELCMGSLQALTVGHALHPKAYHNK